VFSLFYLKRVLSFFKFVVVTPLLKPVNQFLHLLGIWFSIYIDDSRILGTSEVDTVD